MTTFIELSAEEVSEQILINLDKITSIYGNGDHAIVNTSDGKKIRVWEDYADIYRIISKHNCIRSRA